MNNILPNIDSEFTDIFFFFLSTGETIEVDSLRMSNFSKSSLLDILNKRPNAYENNTINITDLLVKNEDVARITARQQRYKENPDGSGIYIPVETISYPHYKIEMVTTFEIGSLVYLVRITLGNVQVEFNDLRSTNQDGFKYFSDIDFKIMHGDNKFEILNGGE